MLAYVFWHWPAVDDELYRSALFAFHRALAADPPRGFHGSAVGRVAGVPWLPAGGGYEDWYFVDDFAALGALSDAAVSGSRRAPHDGAARLAADGTAGLYRLVAGDLAATGAVSWRSKPAHLRYDDFVPSLAVGAAAVWQRQLVLGPTPEFCVLGAAPPPPALVSTVERLGRFEVA